MKILFVAMADSITSARWISQIVDQGWDIRLFPVKDWEIHKELRNVSVYNYFRYQHYDLDKSVKVLGSWPFSRGLNFAKSLLYRFLPSGLEKVEQLTKTIRKFKPDILHSLEMQRAGYLTYQSREKMPDDRFPKWIYSCWGNDIYYYGKKPEHKPKIKNVLKTCDFYTSDCKRDISLARDFGFQGKVMGVFPGGGGYNINSMIKFCQSGQTSNRNIIALKVSHIGLYGRPLLALHALYLCAKHIRDYEIVIFSSPPNFKTIAEYFSTIIGIPVTILPQSSHNQVLKLLGSARIAIGFNTSDGTPNAMLEAMIMRAFPIQSDTISTAEWINHAENGLLVTPEDPEELADAIQRAIYDDRLVNRAAEINKKLTVERLDKSKIQPKVVEMYKKIEDTNI